VSGEWKWYWRRKKKRDRRQQSFSFLSRPSRQIPRAVRASLPKVCEVEGCGRPARAAHHMCPVRLAYRTEGVDPHDPRNILAVCVGCNNGAKLGERRLASGDRHGFLEHMRKRNFPMERVLKALALYGW
jgi:hypothetical protein